MEVLEFPRWQLQVLLLFRGFLQVLFPLAEILVLLLLLGVFLPLPHRLVLARLGSVP